jgi:hypothetical protein
MAKSARPHAVTIVVVALCFTAGFQLLFGALDSSPTAQPPGFSLPRWATFIDPLLILVVAYGYYKLKKWSVVLFALYLLLVTVILLLARPQRLPIVGIASILILISMANQWKRGTLS